MEVYEIFEKHGFKRVSALEFPRGNIEVRIYDYYINFDSLMKVVEDLKKHNMRIRSIQIDTDFRHGENGPTIITYFVMNIVRE